MVKYYSTERWKAITDGLKKKILRSADPECVCYLDLAGLKTVKVVYGDPEAYKLISREFAWVLTDPVEDPDATVFLWREPDVRSFGENLFGSELKYPGEDCYSLIKVTDLSLEGHPAWPAGQVNLDSRTIHFSDGDTYYYGTESFEPGKWIAEGHLFVQILFRIMNGMPSAKLVHGACVGVDGNGILICARGQKGKSTLAVTSMLDGFDFVSEDYLLLEREKDSLFASPLYSIMTLSPFMYDKLYDSLGRARFMGVGPFKGKYLFDISDFRDQVKWHYPIKACVFPEITPDATEPRVEPCGPMEKNRAITHIAHSTLFQMWSHGFKQKQADQDFMLSIIGMLNGLDFYKIILTPDIFANAECLRSFVGTLSHSSCLS